MELDQFWSIVEHARHDANAAGDSFDEVAVAEALVVRLTALSRDEILDFDNLLGEVCEELDTWEMAVACQLITGFLSDDLFSSFRAGLVGLGRETVEQLIAEPDSLADHPVVIAIAEGRLDRMALDSEDLLFAAESAYTELSDGDEESFWEAANARQEERDGVQRDWDYGPDDAERIPQRLPRLSSLLPLGRWESTPLPPHPLPDADPED